MRTKNSTKCHFMVLAMRRFWGSPTECCDPTQGSTNRAMHQEISEKSPELLEFAVTMFLDSIVHAAVMGIGTLMSGSEAMKNIEKPIRHRNDYGYNGQGIQESR